MNVEIDGITNHLEWTSMVLDGRCLELPDELPDAEQRDHARKLSKSRSPWWQDASASRQAIGENFIPPVFHCGDINFMTGYRAIADGSNAAAVVRTPASSRIT